MIHQVALRFENGIVLSLGKPHRHRDIIRLACEQFGWDAVPVHEQERLVGQRERRHRGRRPETCGRQALKT